MAETVYKQIAAELRQQILGGTLAPGADVPTEADLAEQWRTSRGPIRNALAELRSEGLIETTRGRPARVTGRKAHQRVDVSIAFTQWAHEIGAVPGAQTQEIALRRCDPDQAIVFGIAPGDPIVEVLRLRLLDGRPTMLERLRYIEEAGRILFDADLDAISITAHLAENGFDSTDVAHEIDAVGADAVDSALLDVDPGTPIIRLHRTTRTASGLLFEASDDRYRSDIVRFTVSATGRPLPDDRYVRALGA